MTNRSEKARRRSIRLPGYDYASPGAYLVTVCAYNGECLFGDIVDDEMQLNRRGQTACDEWYASEQIRTEVKLDAFVVMPNHLHGIVWFVSPVGSHGRAPVPADPASGGALRRPRRSLGSFIAGYKSAVTKRVNELRATPGKPLWQRNYWEHVIRDDGSLNEIREYIENNPARWAEDQLHPLAPPNPFGGWHHPR
jgi:putative transposase